MVPKMFTSRFVRQRMARTQERSNEDRPVRSAEIEGDIELFPAQIANNAQVAPPGRALRSQRKGPGMIDAWRELKHFGSDHRR